MVNNVQDWNKLIEGLPGAHVLQSYEWGQLKARYGWEPLPVVWLKEGPGWAMQRLPAEGLAGRTPAGSAPASVAAAALVLQRALPVRGLAARLRMLYAPKGPLLDWANEPLRRQVLADLHGLARRQGAFLIKIDPDVPLGSGIPGTPEAATDPLGQALLAELQARGWRFSNEQVQFRNTVRIDLQGDESELLARMKQKTRYNIRLAQRKGVTVRLGSREDLDLLYQMYAETSLRDGFVIREEGYYRAVWDSLMAAGLAEPLIAEVEGEAVDPAVAAVIVFRFGRTAWYQYGMSLDRHRERMPNYLLQWEAMLRAKAHGCQVYDLWGAPDEFNESDSMWGVFRFKEGLGGQVVRHIGAWDLPVNPLLYSLYAQALPRLLDVMRRRGRAQTRRRVEGAA